MVGGAPGESEGKAEPDEPSLGRRTARGTRVTPVGVRPGPRQRRSRSARRRGCRRATSREEECCSRD